ncbi:hypothetical protein BZA05DRAFT_381548 [Tricharina praecox]|uniref:uncharacterized protein n=1 Tax=Tricharina praecox TaxID=43433 RepID=UPI00221E8ED3|nr:uncharacterized protein BZA05DRAFT_381548 [Tricharina praecox]KAI5858537.1 hypothetical protein BZA05DRAFT_381548 [Tricharina praecox]
MPPPLTLEISSSIIFPRSNSLGDGSIVIDVSPPSPAGGSRPMQQPLRKDVLKTGPEHPIYRLPQSISSGGLKVHLNQYTPPNPRGIEKIQRRSLISAIDEEHIIFEIAKASLGDAGAEYAIHNFLREDGEGSYGRGSVKFTPGWFSGGVWTVAYVYKSAGQVQESRVDLRVDEGGKEDGIWKMTFPMEGVIARERPQEEGAFAENGRSIDIVDGSPGLEGWSDAEWRDFLAACWITKVWNICTRTQWFSASIRKGEANGLRTW